MFVLVMVAFMVVVAIGVIVLSLLAYWYDRYFRDGFDGKHRKGG